MEDICLVSNAFRILTKGIIPPVISCLISGGGCCSLWSQAAMPGWDPTVARAVPPEPPHPWAPTRVGQVWPTPSAQTSLATPRSILDFAPLFSLLMWFCLFLQVSQSAPSPVCLYFWKPFCLVPVIPLTSFSCSGLPLPVPLLGLNWDLFRY